MQGNANLTFVIREAKQEDAEQLAAFLSTNQQSAHAVLVPTSRYWVALDQEQHIVGAIGLEFGNEAVLLRSAGVAVSARRQRIGTLLTQQALQAARDARCQRVYLFSTDAGSYWIGHGFHQVEVPELVAALPDAPQVRQYDMLGWLPTEVAWRRDLEDLAHK